MRFIPNGLREFGLAAIVAVGVGSCGDPLKIEPIKRFSEGKILNLNRLEVDWKDNEKCNNINPKYGYTTGDLVLANIRDVLRGTRSYNLFDRGFLGGAFIEDRQTRILIEPSSSYRGNAMMYWRTGSPYVIESAEPESTLVRIGQQIYDNACNDPELSQ